MTQDSAVHFPSHSRIHIALAVKDLELSMAFYRILLGQGPSKRRPRYAKFEVLEPSLNLALNEYDGPTQPVNPITHFGVQLKSTALVKEIADRLRDQGEQIIVEDGVTCCYAKQNKIWATDPDGNKWEVYVLLDDNADSHERRPGQCCAHGQDDKVIVQVESSTASAGAPCCGLNVSSACC